MPYQITLNSQNVLVPLALDDGHGHRLRTPLAKLDTATAMVIKVSNTGTFSQEFFPLKIVQGQSQAYAGKEWELWVQKISGVDFHTYYIGVPNLFFLGQSEPVSARSLSIQVIGTSPLTGREEFSGGVDLTLHAEVKAPLIPGFLNLSERFFPTLLPENFIEKNILDVFEFKGRRQWLLLSSIHIDSTDRIPISLEKHWDAKNWINAVVENLNSQTDSYSIIQGGCFCSRNLKISHWFGGRIGLEESHFRLAASEKIKAMASGGNGGWVFWLEPQGAAALEKAMDSKSIRISIRHPILHQLLKFKPGRNVLKSDDIQLADLPAEKVIEALYHAAQILMNHQNSFHQARSEPAHAVWSKLKPHVQNPAQIFGEGTEENTVDRRIAPRAGLETDIRQLYKTQGEILRVLELRFDAASGYLAWDAIGNPLRENLAAYLGEISTEAQGAREIP